MQQKHKGSGDNVSGSKVTFVSIKGFKQGMIIFISFCLLLVAAIYFFKDRFIKIYIDNLMSDLAYHVENYSSRNSPNSYNRILEKLDDVESYEMHKYLNAPQLSMIGGAYATIGKFNDASSYYKDSYKKYKLKNEPNNIVSLWGSYCFCEAFQGKSLNYFHHETNYILSLQSEAEMKKMIDSIKSMCLAIKSAKSNNIALVIKNLKDFKEVFNPAWYTGINSVNALLDDDLKKNKDYNLLLFDLNEMNQKFFNPNLLNK